MPKPKLTQALHDKLLRLGMLSVVIFDHNKSKDNSLAATTRYNTACHQHLQIMLSLTKEERKQWL